MYVPYMYLLINTFTCVNSKYHHSQIKLHMYMYVPYMYLLLNTFTCVNSKYHHSQTKLHVYIYTCTCMYLTCIY